MSSGRIRKNTRESTSGAALGSRETCKTCTPCRQKKVKCDGTRPQCHECNTTGLDCVYARDARREPRPSHAQVQSLEATVATMLEHMKTSGILPAHIQASDCLPPGTNVSSVGARDQGQNHLFQGESLDHLASTAAVARPLPTPSVSSVSSRHDFSTKSPLPEISKIVSSTDRVSYQPLVGDEKEGSYDSGNPRSQQPTTTNNPMHAGFSGVASSLSQRQIHQDPWYYGADGRYELHVVFAERHY